YFWFRRRNSQAHTRPDIFFPVTSGYLQRSCQSGNQIGFLGDSFLLMSGPLNSGWPSSRALNRIVLSTKAVPCPLRHCCSKRPQSERKRDQPPPPRPNQAHGRIVQSRPELSGQATQQW